MTSKEFVEMGKMVEAKDGEAVCVFRLYSEGDGIYFGYTYSENMPCSLEYFKINALAAAVANMIYMRCGAPEKNFNTFLKALSEHYRSIVDKNNQSIEKILLDGRLSTADEVVKMCKEIINKPAPKKRGRPRKEGRP